MQRTGSELVLFNLLPYLDKSIDLQVISKYKGELYNNLPATVKKDFLFYFLPKNRVQKLIHRFQRKGIISNKLPRQKNSVWYLNTILSPDILEAAENNKIDVILHVHELEHMFRLLSESQIQRLIRYPGLIIANSNASKKILMKLGRQENIEICYPPVDTAAVIKDTTVRNAYRKKMGISQKSFVWTMCGTLDENKNPFLFIDIARQVISVYPDAVFLWIGNANDTAYEKTCKERAEEKGVAKNIRWINPVGKEYLHYFNTADGFVLTSKKESFSLVTVEALLLELPVVANDCEGVREIINDPLTGKIVPGENAVNMAKEMIAFMNGSAIFNPALAKESTKRFDIRVIEKEWNRLIQHYLTIH